jgi:hypothetical protein
MSMSGWAENPDKQPWTWGEPYTSINRMYACGESKSAPPPPPPLTPRAGT